MSHLQRERITTLVEEIQILWTVRLSEFGTQR